jgi:hypothetical protein
MRVTIEARGGHNGAGTGGHYGSWARIWASREGIASVTTVIDDHKYLPGRLDYHEDHVAVDVETTGDFDPERDYILVEHKRSPNPYLGGSSSRESYELLFGKMPAWADFPRAWAAWVHDKNVQASAVDHILRRVPDARAEVEYAQRKRAKGTISGAWEVVARLCATATGRSMDGIWGTGSWTAVEAIPIRIAQRLGGWSPPVPRPIYEKNGAVLVAKP